MLSTIGVVLMCSLLSVVSSLGYFYWPYWMLRRVPGPPLFPFLGHLPLLAKYGPDVFSILAKQYGPIFRFHMGRQVLVIVADAELCREVGIRKFRYFPNRSIPSPISASSLHQKGLFFSRGSRWSRMRNTIISMYQPSHLASLVPTMQTLIKSAVQNLSSHNLHQQDLDFSSLSLKLATDIIGQTAFGINFGLSIPPNSRIDHINLRNESSDFIKQHIYSTTTLKMDLSGSLSIIVGLLFPVLQAPLSLLLRRLPCTTDWVMNKTNQKLTTRLHEIVSSRINNRATTGSKDFLSLVVSAKDSETKGLFTSDYISALTYEHLLAGSATTSFTLSSILYLVSAHPEVERRLVQEIDGFGPHDQDPTAHDLQHRFPYMDQVIKEATRIYTVSPLVAREAVAPVEIGGYPLPKGTWVWLAPGVLAKDSKNFPDPHKFKPERFDRNRDEEWKRHPYAHIPFGIGPRACIGQKFALQEIKLCLIHLYRNYVFGHSPRMENPLEVQYGMVLSFKNGVNLRVVKREQGGG